MLLRAVQFPDYLREREREEPKEVRLELALEFLEF